MKPSVILLAVLICVSAIFIINFNKNEPQENLVEPQKLQFESFVNLNFKHTPLKRILLSIKNQTGVTITVKGRKIKQVMDISVENLTVEETLEKIVVGKDWFWRLNPESNEYEIWNRGNRR